MTEVERTVREDTVTIARSYDTTVEDLWDVVTNPERIVRWFLPVSGDLRVGGHYALEGHASGTIETCDPPESFSATWESGGEVSRIAVRLRPDGDGARLELVHSGLGGDRWDEFGPGAVGLGWDALVMGLGLHLETGDAGDPSWIASDEAKRFFTECSESWREAHVAAGADPEVAQASAERTRVAYTG